MVSHLICESSAGIYCEAGDFYVDPWLPVPRAIITHAHADHARPGSDSYLTVNSGADVLQMRLGESARVDSMAYGESMTINGVRVSLHPAGHILGSAQVRLEYRDEICVISGDYKLDRDPTCPPFESLRCHTFVTESTFGLPVYRWPTESALFQEINDWWRQNAEDGRASLVFAYALGKAQRLLAGLDAAIGPLFCHGAVVGMNRAYESAGVGLPPTAYVGDMPKNHDWAGALIVAPPSAMGSMWLRRFPDPATAFVSGHMLVRGARRRRSVDRGFPLSDHADWPGLRQAITSTGAERVLVTHGEVLPMVRWLNEQGIAAAPLQTRFEGEQDDGASDASPAAETPE